MFVHHFISALVKLSPTSQPSSDGSVLRSDSSTQYIDKKPSYQPDLVDAQNTKDLAL